MSGNKLKCSSANGFQVQQDVLCTGTYFRITIGACALGPHMSREMRGAHEIQASDLGHVDPVMKVMAVLLPQGASAMPRSTCLGRCLHELPVPCRSDCLE